MKWDELPSDDVVEKTAEAIRSRGMEVIVVNSGKEAFEKILGIIPNGAEIANGSSTTLYQIGFVDYLKSGRHKWKNLHEEVLKERNEEKQEILRRKMVAAEYFVASVNAIARTGELVACDASGSRVSAYPYAAKHLILVAGAQKIAPTLADAMRRVREYAFPLENKRAMEAYGVPSTTGKWVIIEREIFPKRTTLILVRETLGF